MPETPGSRAAERIAMLAEALQIILPALEGRTASFTRPLPRVDENSQFHLVPRHPQETPPGVSVGCSKRSAADITK